MRGHDSVHGSMFGYRTVEERILLAHPLRQIRPLFGLALQGTEPLLEARYCAVGRPSTAPEKLLRASLLRVLCGVPDELRLMEWIDFNLAFRWFVGLEMDDPVWHATVLSNDRDRMSSGEIVESLFGQVLAQARAERLLSEDHFNLDGTLIEAKASRKSYQEKSDPRKRARAAKSADGSLCYVDVVVKWQAKSSGWFSTTGFGAGLVSVLLSTLRSDPMVLDGLQGRYRLAGKSAKPLQDS